MPGTITATSKLDKAIRLTLKRPSRIQQQRAIGSGKASLRSAGPVTVAGHSMGGRRVTKYGGKEIHASWP